MDNLYTTPQASQVTGIPEGTIRSWLSRHPGVFQIDVHLIADEHGQKLWTEAGIELLRSRRASKNAADDVAENDAGDLLESLLDHSAETLALEYWRLLPGRVLHRIKQMQQNPTPQQRQVIQTSVHAAINAGTEHLLLPTYQPILLGGDEQPTTND
ncbi:hypothetical protein H6G33_04165 [Calothrix sp. FACHB-1219]|uniref:hypothetical protein n=1 Tax=unclassified Calothrix TaxID=2619626 RepID=UPI001686BE16|nr:MULTISPECIES: hypothetical protein [unclassified Calothrix]MBD2204952.1 hypothetical protein [Calothrix sp. FACHB-168]MBD2216223.1 hypothetical protein [Calothrix sp. FACHB-1219]